MDNWWGSRFISSRFTFHVLNHVLAKRSICLRSKLDYVVWNISGCYDIRRYCLNIYLKKCVVIYISNAWESSLVRQPPACQNFNKLQVSNLNEVYTC